MKTYVTERDYIAILKCFTEDEIREKYGFLMVKKKWREENEN